MGSGATFAEISKSTVEVFEIPLPPLQEQTRIAGVLNEHMAAVERARAAAEAQLEAAKALPVAYLRAVFSSAEAQLWPLRRLGEVAPIIQNGIYKTSDNYGHGHPFLRMYNVQNDSWKLTLQPLALVALGGSERIIFGLKKGDLLISRVNSYELVGKCAWVGSEAEGYVFENMLIRVRLEQSVDSLFVAQQFATCGVREQIETVAKRAIGQASINSEDVRSIRLLLPALADQQRIAAMLNEQMASGCARPSKKNWTSSTNCPPPSCAGPSTGNCKACQ
jgi:type I restriction enzyme S subunit